jgi:hypothetical protein
MSTIPIVLWKMATAGTLFCPNYRQIQHAVIVEVPFSQQSLLQCYKFQGPILPSPILKFSEYLYGNVIFLLMS